MKLTTEQIKIVENTLDLNGLIYDDMKLEVLDHIASEIEAKMSTEYIPFEETYKSIFENWKEQLTPTSIEFIFGKSLRGPKLIMDKIKFNKIRELKLGAISVILFTLLIAGLLSITMNEFFAKFLSSIIRITYFAGCILILVARIFLMKAKTKTSFSFRFNNNFINPMLFGISIALNAFPNKNNLEDISFYCTSLLWKLICLYLIINTLRLAYQHFQFETKYAKL